MGKGLSASDRLPAVDPGQVGPSKAEKLLILWWLLALLLVFMITVGTAGAELHLPLFGGLGRGLLGAVLLSSSGTTGSHFSSYIPFADFIKKMLLL